MGFISRILRLHETLKNAMRTERDASVGVENIVGSRAPPLYCYYTYLITKETQVLISDYYIYYTHTRALAAA
jgi:hypothetical protein